MGVRGIVVLALCLALAAGCADPPPGTGAAPHGDAAPPHAVTLTDADIDAWLAAIGGYRAAVSQQSVVGEACYLITQAQGRADLAHPDGQWTLDAGTDGAARPGQPAGSECLVRAPSQSFGLGPPANGDVGGVVRIQQGWQPPRQMFAGPYLQVPIPGTSWSLIYLAWHVRQPSADEMAWVLRDLVVNWSQPPPARPPSAYLVR